MFTDCVAAVAVAVVVFCPDSRPVVIVLDIWFRLALTPPFFFPFFFSLVFLILLSKHSYSLECGTSNYGAFLIFVVFYMAAFTFVFPLCILLVLCKNRKKLWTPKVMDAYGFLYARFQVGTELWDLHELLRKLLLTAVLLMLQSNTRNAAAILICTLANCTLNFYRPHRNRLVLRVAQLSFLLSTIKYLCAMLLSLFSADYSHAVAGGKTAHADVENIGYMLVVMDVLFVASSIGTAIAVVVSTVRFCAAGRTLRSSAGHTD